MDAEFARSSAPQPTQAALHTLLSRMSRVRIVEGGMAGGEPLGRTVLLEVEDEAALEELRNALTILDGPAGHCGCHGDPSLELRSFQGERLAVLGIHHGQTLRWAEWKDDAELMDGRRLLDWMAHRGVDKPLASYQEALQLKEEGERKRKAWLQAMPLELKQLPEDLWKKAAASNDLTPVLDAIKATGSDGSARILGLFRWFGSGW